MSIFRLPRLMAVQNVLPFTSLFGLAFVDSMRFEQYTLHQEDVTILADKAGSEYVR